MSPSKRRLRRGPLARCLFAAFALAVLALAYEVAARWTGRGPWLGVTGAASLALATGALVALHLHLTALFAGHMSYSRAVAHSSDLAVVPPEGLWTVRVRNPNAGRVNLEGVLYDVELVAPDITLTGATFAEVAEILGNLRDEPDVYLSIWTEGMAFAPAETRVLWQFPPRLWPRIRRLDAHLTYRTAFGDLHVMTVGCVPPHGLPVPTPA